MPVRRNGKTWQTQGIARPQTDRLPEQLAEDPGGAQQEVFGEARRMLETRRRATRHPRGQAGSRRCAIPAGVMSGDAEGSHGPAAC